jgi:putative phage-type endonuclease
VKKRTELEQIDRRKFIGGSDVAAIIGVSPWQTPYSLWEKKTAPDGAIDESEVDKAKIFARGKRLEPVVIEMLQDEEPDVHIVDRQVRVVDPDYPFLQAEIDFVSEERCEFLNGEIKTSSAFISSDEWGPSGSVQIPHWYTAQVMHGMMITGRQNCRVAALIGTDDMRTYVIERNEELIIHIRRKSVEFWNDHVIAKSAPPMKTADDARKVQRFYRGITLPATEELENAALTLLQLKAEISEKEKEKDGLEARIQLALAEAAREMALPVSLVDDKENNAYLLDHTGYKIVSWNVQNDTRVNQAILKEKFPNIFSFVNRTKKIRVMRTHKPKKEK